MDGQQLTPPQLLEAGHRAERQGQAELAAQFYHYLAEHFSFTPEAAEARNGLGRLTALPRALTSSINGAHLNGATRPHRRRMSAARNHYPIGHVLSRLLTMIGWAAVGFGVVAPGLYAGLRQLAMATNPDLRLLYVAEAGAALASAGLLTVLLGQLARAVFDQANALRELVAQERARGWSE